MNKRHLHHVWTKLRIVKPQYLLALTLVSGVVCVLALRANNEHMITLRSAVYAADKNDTDVQGALQKLQAYVTTHMNTNLSSGADTVYPPIQLKYTYDRLVQAQSDQLAQTNTQLYTEAQDYCQQKDPTDFSGHNRVPCIEQYVTAHSNITLPSIPAALYEFAFVSPRWSPDLAGWSLLATVILALLCIAGFIADRWFRKYVV